MGRKRYHKNDPHSIGLVVVKLGVGAGILTIIPIEFIEVGAGVSLWPRLSVCLANVAEKC